MRLFRKATHLTWLEERGGSFHLGVRIGSRKLKRSLKTDDRIEAEKHSARVQGRLTLIQQGELTVPVEVDLLDLLLETKPKATEIAVPPSHHPLWWTSQNSIWTQHRSELWRQERTGSCDFTSANSRGCLGQHFVSTDCISPICSTTFTFAQMLPAVVVVD